MKILILLPLLIFSKNVRANCFNFKGKWAKCTVDTPRLNYVQGKLLNSYLKAYNLDITSLGENTLRFLGTYKPFLSRRKTVHDNIVEFNKKITFLWEDLPDGRRGPMLDTYSVCENNVIYEDITWVNLNNSTYSQEYVDSNDKYFKSEYFISENYLHRVIESKKNKEDEFKYLGTLSCQKN
tara:strand:+ start:24 stop:566 length:543 start_codon:yes stop_codon:yes gene_type:complete